jgi:ectoine hydroxylase-related dioxygenase (phytanoyl-CoA dioxygenase family)
MTILNRLPSSPEINAYKEAGVVLLPGLVTDDWVTQIRDAVEGDLKNASYSANRLFCDGMMMWKRDAVFEAYCLNQELPEAAAVLMTSDKVNLLYDQYLVKEPGGTAAVGKTKWHHDQPYWPIRGGQIVTLWLALDDIDDSTGRVEFVAGSHKSSDLYQPEGITESDYQYSKNPDYRPIPDIDACREDYEIQSWDMSPGDILAFHGRTIHGAKGNQNSTRRRRALAIRYVGEDVTYYDGPGSYEGLKSSDLTNGEKYRKQKPLLREDTLADSVDWGC